MYFADSATSDFATANVPGLNQAQTANFIVTGTPISATPEPSSLLLLGTGLIGFGSALRRRFA